MTAEGLFSTILSAEVVVILILMAFNAYFFVQKPILHYLREIYFINVAGFRMAWYLVICATTFFLLNEVFRLLGSVGWVVPPEIAANTSTVLTLCFATLIMLAFAIVFGVFAKYVRRLPAPIDEIANRIAQDLDASVLAQDRSLRIDLDLSRWGDVSTGRHRLGPYVSLSHYRALTAGFSGYMETKLGHMGNAIMYAVGRITGRRATADLVRENPSGDQALELMFAEMRGHGIAIAEVGQRTEDRVDVVLHESAAAAGAQPMGKPLCHYQAGLLAGIFEAVTGRTTQARETKCWGLGDRLCEFRIDLNH